MFFGYAFWAQMDTNPAIQQLTQNLCLNIPFHPYIHDQDLDHATTKFFSHTFTQRKKKKKGKIPSLGPSPNPNP